MKSATVRLCCALRSAPLRPGRATRGKAGLPHLECHGKALPCASLRTPQARACDPGKGRAPASGVVDGGSRVRSHEGGCFCVHGTPRRARDGPTGERQSAFHRLAVVRPRAQGSPVESWQCFGYVAFALALPRGRNTQRPTRVTHARRAPAQHHLCTEIRAPRAQRSTSATQPVLASSETLLRNLGRASTWAPMTHALT